MYTFWFQIEFEVLSKYQINNFKFQLDSSKKSTGKEVDHNIFTALLYYVYKGEILRPMILLDHVKSFSVSVVRMNCINSWCSR